jgi:hypothetical protein
MSLENSINNMFNGLVLIFIYYIINIIKRRLFIKVILQFKILNSTRQG